MSGSRAPHPAFRRLSGAGRIPSRLPPGSFDGGRPKQRRGAPMGRVSASLEPLRPQIQFRPGSPVLRPSVFLPLKANCHTALTAHGASEQRQIPFSALHRVHGGWRQRLLFHHSVGENISVHIREGGKIALP